MEETPNHNLNLYERGASDWTHRPDMESIEERLPIRDTEANLEGEHVDWQAGYEAMLGIVADAIVKERP